MLRDRVIRELQGLSGLTLKTKAKRLGGKRSGGGIWRFASEL